jgi:hypothetical protein
VEITYGTPIMITVDDLEHVAAFANYKVDAISSATPVVPPPLAAAAAVVTPVASPPPLPVAAPAPIATQSSGGLEEQGHDLSQIAAAVKKFIPSAAVATTAASGMFRLSHVR